MTAESEATKIQVQRQWDLMEQLYYDMQVEADRHNIYPSTIYAFIAGVQKMNELAAVDNGFTMEYMNEIKAIGEEKGREAFGVVKEKHKNHGQTNSSGV